MSDGTSTGGTEQCESCEKPPKGVTMAPGMEGWSCPYCGQYNRFEDRARTDGGTERGGTDRTECWKCGHQRLIYEACSECGALGSDRDV